MQLVSILKNSKSKPKGRSIQFKKSVEKFVSSEEVSQDYRAYPAQ
jgi:hypothetical protein